MINKQFQFDVGEFAWCLSEKKAARVEVMAIDYHKGKTHPTSEPMVETTYRVMNDDGHAWSELEKNVHATKEELVESIIKS